MVARVVLVCEKRSYCVLTYFDLDGRSDLDGITLIQQPNLRTYFSCSNGDKAGALEKAREFGKGIANVNNTKLEENL